MVAPTTTAQRLPGFSAEQAVTRPARAHSGTTRADTTGRGEVVAAEDYHCPPDISTCDCFGLWDCVKCTILEWPTVCKNPFEVKARGRR